MIDQAQLLKGVLEGCILEIISRGETYGYQITEDLNHLGLENIDEGSVYPVLIRLQKKGCLSSQSKKSPLGPKRKYFSLTSDGEDYLKAFNTTWHQLSSVINNILKGATDEQDREK